MVEELALLSKKSSFCSFFTSLYASLYGCSCYRSLPFLFNASPQGSALFPQGPRFYPNLLMNFGPSSVPNVLLHDYLHRTKRFELHWSGHVSLCRESYYSRWLIAQEFRQLSRHGPGSMCFSVFKTWYKLVVVCHQDPNVLSCIRQYQAPSC